MLRLLLDIHNMVGVFSHSTQLPLDFVEGRVQPVF